MEIAEQDYLLHSIDEELKAIDVLHRCAGDAVKKSYYKGMHDMLKNIRVLVVNFNELDIPNKSK